MHRIRAELQGEHDGRVRGVRPSEAEQLIEATEVLKYDEGLHIDGQLKLFHGFVTRGSMFTFIRKLNVKMNDQRKRLQALADDARTAEM